MAIQPDSKTIKEIPKFIDTWQEFNWLCDRLGYPSSQRMSPRVWEGNKRVDGKQESVLIEYWDRLEKSHPEVTELRKGKPIQTVTKPKFEITDYRYGDDTW